MINLKTTLKLSAFSLALLSSIYVSADQVFLDDIIVDGSACIGQDCVNGESFGFDTIRIKENNLRIRAQDTSSTSSFPSRDWQITFNDSSNGGLNKFSIDDIDGGRTPFTIEANAPTSSLYVDDAGRIGLGTATPVVELHIKDGDSPTLRLEQDGSSGFTPQTWDLAGNETNFFVRDATNGSTLPFRIRPGAPSSAIDIAANGNVGIGTGSPASDLHIITDAEISNYALTIENTEASVINSGGIILKNVGSNFISFEDTSAAAITPVWKIGSRVTGDFRIVNAAKSGEEFILEQNGNLTISGDLTANGSLYASSKALKENFTSINGLSILNSILDLSITKWNYKSRNPNVQHIGPMAEDFHKAFSLNGDRTDSISASDINGVTIVAIQELKKIIDKKDSDIAFLKTEIRNIKARIK